MEGFIEFVRPRRTTVTPSAPSVSLNKSGGFVLNPLAVKTLDEDRDFVALLFHPEKRLVGIRAVPHTHPGAYKLRITKGGSGQVSGGQFCDQFGIDYSQRSIFEASGEGGLLTFSVASAMRK